MGMRQDAHGYNYRKVVGDVNWLLLKRLLLVARSWLGNVWTA